MLGQGEPDHPARGDVDHRRQIQPAFPGPDVGDVTTPTGVDRGGVDGEVPADQVGSGGRRRVRNSGLVPAARRAAPQPGAVHQPGHPLAAVVVAAPAQRGVDAWRPVAALGRLVGLADLLGQPSVGDLPGRRGAESLGVGGGTGDLQQLAGPLDVARLCLLRLDEPIHVHRVSVTKNAVARLRISTSSHEPRLVRPGAPTRHRGLGQIEVPADPPGRAVTTLAQLNDLGLELCGERPARARSLALVASHDPHDGHPLPGMPLIVAVRQSGSGPPLSALGVRVASHRDVCR